jgi:oligo-1,6-glucosidase
MVFQFDHVELDQGRDKWDVRPLDLVALKRTLERWQVGLADLGWNSLYWNNHDQPRAVSRWGDETTYREESAKLLATVLHLHRGTPYVYQGEELGMTNMPFHSIDDFVDIQSRNHYVEATTRLGRPAELVLDALRERSRDNGRTPMQWDVPNTPGSAREHRGCGSTRTSSTSTRPRRSTIPVRSSRTTGRSSSCVGRNPSSPTASSLCS